MTITPLYWLQFGILVLFNFVIDFGQLVIPILAKNIAEKQFWNSDKILILCCAPFVPCLIFQPILAKLTEDHNNLPKLMLVGFGTCAFSSLWGASGLWHQQFDLILMSQLVYSFGYFTIYNCQLIYQDIYCRKLDKVTLMFGLNSFFHALLLIINIVLVCVFYAVLGENVGHVMIISLQLNLSGLFLFYVFCKIERHIKDNQIKQQDMVINDNNEECDDKKELISRSKFLNEEICEEIKESQENAEQTYTSQIFQPQQIAKNKSVAIEKSFFFDLLDSMFSLNLKTLVLLCCNFCIGAVQWFLITESIDLYTSKWNLNLTNSGNHIFKFVIIQLLSKAITTLITYYWGFRSILLTLSGISTAMCLFIISQIDTPQTQGNVIEIMTIAIPIFSGICSSIYYNMLSFLNDEKTMKMATSLSIIFENIGQFTFSIITHYLCQGQDVSLKIKFWNQNLSIMAMVSQIGGVLAFFLTVMDYSGDRVLGNPEGVMHVQLNCQREKKNKNDKFEDSIEEGSKFYIKCDKNHSETKSDVAFNRVRGESYVGSVKNRERLKSDGGVCVL